MQWNDELVANLDSALEDANVCGLTYDEPRDQARLYIEVMSLPISGPIDSDHRRVVVISGVTSIEIRYSADTAEPSPLIPLSSLDEVEELLATAGWAHPMYGGYFVDIAEPRPHYRREPSLRAGPGPRRTGHSLDWFTECGPLAGHDGGALLDGTIYFDGDLWAERADGTVITADEFGQLVGDGGTPSPRTTSGSGKRSSGRLSERPPAGDPLNRVPSWSRPATGTDS